MLNKTTLPHWDYLDRTIHARWDFTALDRLPTAVSYTHLTLPTNA